MRFEIFSPKKLSVRDGRLRKAIVWAESIEEEKQLHDFIEKLSGDGWPRTPAPQDDIVLDKKSDEIIVDNKKESA